MNRLALIFGVLLLTACNTFASIDDPEDRDQLDMNNATDGVNDEGVGSDTGDLSDDACISPTETEVRRILFDRCETTSYQDECGKDWELELNCPPGIPCSDGFCECDCSIGNTCLQDGAENPANTCQVCRSQEDDEDWSANTGAVCGGITAYCAAGTCSGQTCEITVLDDRCFVDDKCYQPGDRPYDVALMRESDCRMCDPDNSKTSWTNLEVACESGTCLTGMCENGECVNVSDTPVTMCKDGYCPGTCMLNDICFPSRQEPCTIQGVCYPDGYVNPENTCQRCEGTRDVSNWSTFPDDTPCSTRTLTDGRCMLGQCMPP